MDSLKEMRKYQINIDGINIYTDYRELYEAYTSVKELSEQEAETFGEQLKLAGLQIGSWLDKMISEKKLNESEAARARYSVEGFNKAVLYYEKYEDEAGTALEMAIEWILDISDLEDNFLSKTIVDPEEFRDTEDGRLRRETFALVAEIESIHAGSDGNMINVCDAGEQKVLDNLGELTEKYGHHDLYLWRAALSACNNWASMQLVRESSFSLDLADAIDHYGSLAPERLIDWAVMQNITEANPEMYFIEGMERLYDIICTAMEQGDDTVAYMASVVRDIIWEPENPIDED